MNYAEQMERNRKLTGWANDFEGDERLAARHLFSVLSHLEEIAVLAARKGHGVVGQLADELAHRDTFRDIAILCGGVEPCPDPIERLQKFLASLDGPESLAVLNVVAEVWLERVFHAVAPHGPWSELIETIEAEEARHAKEAVGAAEVDPIAIRPLVQTLEKYLFEITVDPAFLWPCAWFTGIRAMGAMGRDCVKAHRKACKVLGVEAGAFAEDIAVCGVHADEDSEPFPKELTRWEEAAFEGELPKMSVELPIRWKHHANRYDVEVRVVKAVAEVLAKYPRLNRSVSHRRQEIYQCLHPVVGTRREHDREGQIMTVYARNAHERDLQPLAQALYDDTVKARSQEYYLPRVPAGLERLAPPSRCSATVTNVVGMYPDDAFGHSALAPFEGPTWSVCAVSWSRRWLRRYLNVSVECDHRVHNGAEMGLFITALKNALIEGPR